MCCSCMVAPRPAEDDEDAAVLWARAQQRETPDVVRSPPWQSSATNFLCASTPRVGTHGGGAGDGPTGAPGGEDGGVGRRSRREREER